MEPYVEMRKGAKRDFVEACTKFYIKELNLTNSRYELVIINEPNMMKTKGLNGGIMQYGPREICIRLESRLSLFQLTLTLAHERVHVKQVAKGRLRTELRDDKMVNYWLGKEMDVEYYFRPWEREAWAQERELAYRLNYCMEQQLD